MNMRSLIIILLIVLTFFLPASAQTKFVVKGKIEFERKTNIHRLFYTEEESSSWDETMRKLIPQFKVDYFDLVFTEDKTLYKPGRDNPDSRKVFFEPPAQANIIFKDLV